MSQPLVTLRPLTRSDLAAITPWFEDPETCRYLGGADWPGSMLDHGERAVGPIVTESIEVATGSLAFAVDPAVRGRGVGRLMIAALIARPELAFVELFEAGVEPENGACRRCLEQAGFSVRSPEPDCEGFLYYRLFSTP